MDTKDFISGETYAEIEEHYEEVVTTILKDFLRACQEHDKDHGESATEKQAEFVFIRHYNKRIDKLMRVLAKKNERLYYLYQQEIAEGKKEFTQEHGAEKMIEVGYKKSSILLAHQKRVAVINAYAEKLYQQVVKLHNQLESKVNSYYLAHSMDHLKQIYQDVEQELKATW